MSTGVSYRVTRDTQIYGFLQQSIHRHVCGTQFTADWAGALGICMRF